MSEEWVAQQGGKPLWTQEDHPLGEQVRAAVDRLPERSREVIELRMWGQYTFREIAEILGLKSKKHAHMIYTRALVKLQREMEKS